MIDSLLRNADSVLLLVCAAATLASGALMIVLRQPMRVAMALITTMIFLGAIYGLLGVHFIAAFQVLIYVGAVMVFMVYVIMLLEVRESDGPRYSRLLVPGKGAFGIAAFSTAFLGEYWLLFELTSVLLVAAVVAALAVIRVSRDSGNRKRHG